MESEEGSSVKDSLGKELSQQNKDLLDILFGFSKKKSKKEFKFDFRQDKDKSADTLDLIKPLQRDFKDKTNDICERKFRIQRKGNKKEKRPLSFDENSNFTKSNTSELDAKTIIKEKLECQKNTIEDNFKNSPKFTKMSLPSSGFTFLRAKDFIAKEKKREKKTKHKIMKEKDIMEGVMNQMENLTLEKDKKAKKVKFKLEYEASN